MAPNFDAAAAAALCVTFLDDCDGLVRRVGGRLAIRGLLSTPISISRLYNVRSTVVAVVVPGIQYIIQQQNRVILVTGSNCLHVANQII